ncbi:MAG: cytochrome b/b6 domain-containing protein, partial [Pseudomonadales bacterium]|nr:cytochrome b/b6 domain-containing protein [Pseudomonadales bacterium]
MSAVLEFETTNGKYQRVSVIIHWLTVLLMVAIYASIEIHQELQRGTTLRRLTEDWHIYLGLTLIPIVIYRALVILRSPIPPIIPAQANWERLAVKLM